MAALDVGVDTATVAPVRRRRKLGGLFIAAVAWIALIGLAAIMLFGHAALSDDWSALLALAFSIFVWVVEAFMFDAILAAGFHIALGFLLVDIFLGLLIEHIARNFG